MRSILLYLQLAERTQYPPTKLRVVSMTQKPPTMREPDSVVVKIRLNIPTEAFRSSSEPVTVLDLTVDQVMLAATSAAAVSVES